MTKRSTNKPGYWTQKRSELLGPYREALNVMNVTPGNAPLGSYAWRRGEHLAAARKERGRLRW